MAILFIRSVFDKIDMSKLKNVLYTPGAQRIQVVLHPTPPDPPCLFRDVCCCFNRKSLKPSVSLFFSWLILDPPLHTPFLSNTFSSIISRWKKPLLKIENQLQDMKLKLFWKPLRYKKPQYKSIILRNEILNLINIRVMWFGRLVRLLSFEFKGQRLPYHTFSSNENTIWFLRLCQHVI